MTSLQGTGAVGRCLPFAAAVAYACAAGHPLLALSPERALQADADTLRQPPTLPNLSHRPGVVEVRLVAAPARLRLREGGPLAQAFAFNGTVPGPTLDLHEGDSVIVHFRNDLPEPTTVHWHGLHIPAGSDGSPLLPIRAGQSHDYAFRVPRGSAGTYWYHPHPDSRTGHQVAMGLFGAIIVRAPDDPLAARGVPDRLLILSDNRFAPDGAVAFPAPGSLDAEIDRENGREGPLLFVNGQLAPTIAVRPGTVERWRVVNASAARVYRVALHDQPLLEVGSDGGLFERATQVASVLLANSERAEVLVRAPPTPATSTALEDLPYDRYMPQTRPPGWDSTRVLLTLRTTGEPALDPVALPAVLRRVPALDTAGVARHRVIVMSQGLLDGRTMDMQRVDLHARLGTTEIWQLQNVVGMDHPFHLHGFRFQVLDRDGVPEPFARWKDSVNVPGHSSVRIVVRFDDFPGKWMYHCHILDHEDEGMMGVLQVH